MKKIIFVVTFIILSATTCFAEFVGIRKEDFDSHYRPQVGPMWCWASCAEMVLSFQGIKLPQDEIVTRIKGFKVNAGGNPMEMIASTNGIFQDTSGRDIVVSGQFVMGAPLPTVLYNHLKRKKPVVLTYQAGPLFGHAVVLTGIDASTGGGQVRITKFYVFDPFCYRQVSDWRGNRLEEDKSLIYKEYHPNPIVNNNIAIEAGIITGVIFVDGVAL